MSLEEKKEQEFDFEKLDIYKRGLKLAFNFFSITKTFPKELQFSLADQLRRASLSIVNNIAEGSGKVYKKEKTHFYRYAINSARECIPIISIARGSDQISEEEYINFRNEITTICKMLAKLIASVEKRDI